MRRFILEFYENVGYCRGWSSGLPSRGDDGVEFQESVMEAYQINLDIAEYCGLPFKGR